MWPASPKSFRVSHHQAKASMIPATGTPSSIHWANPIATPCSSLRYAASKAFGGVPISVAMPPILAA